LAQEAVQLVAQRLAAKKASTPSHVRGVQAECARFIVDRGMDVERLFTQRYALDQAAEAYRLFDTQTTVFLL
jgi:threonine dehydrogenase-like Zn-dependent dehydrogenase